MRNWRGIAFVLVLASLTQAAAIAGTFDECPDPEAAKKFVKSCMQENPYNTREACEKRALEKLCPGK